MRVPVAAGWRSGTPPSSDPAPPGARGQVGEVPSQCLLGGQCLPLSAAAEHLGLPRPPPTRVAVAPLSGSPWKRGSFFQPSTPPPACQTRPSAVRGAWTGGRRGGGGGGPEVGPSLSKTRSGGKQARESRLLPRSMTPPGGLGKRTRGGPLSASVLEDLERAETSASLKPRGALLSIPPPWSSGG